MNQETLENGNTLRSLRTRQATKVSKHKLKRQWQKVAAEALARLNDVKTNEINTSEHNIACLLYTSPSPRDRQKSRMPSSA